MRRQLAFIVMLMQFLAAFLYGCSSGNDIDLTLTIGALVLKKEYEGTGYWEFDDYAFPAGHWVLYDGSAVLEGEDVYEREPLVVGETRFMAPLGYVGQNLNLQVDSDGYIQVQTADPEDKTIHLAYSTTRLNNPTYGSWVESNSFQVNAPIAVNVCPLGKASTAKGFVMRDTLVNKAYDIIIRAYRQNGSFVAAAKVHIESIPDEAYPEEWLDVADYIGIYQANEERTRFCSITLTELTYSDFYEIVYAREKEAA